MLGTGEMTALRHRPRGVFSLVGQTDKKNNQINKYHNYNEWSVLCSKQTGCQQRRESYPVRWSTETSLKRWYLHWEIKVVKRWGMWRVRMVTTPWCHQMSGQLSSSPAGLTIFFFTVHSTRSILQRTKQTKIPAHMGLISVGGWGTVWGKT